VKWDGFSINGERGKPRFRPIAAKVQLGASVFAPAAL
jgi:hypothetical protein